MVGPRAPGRTPTVALATASAFADDIGGEELLVDALAERGAVPTWVPWDDPSVDWATFDLVVVRTTWDYPDRLDAFRAWVRHVAVTTVLVNPARLMLDNLHKSYVADMGDLAVPTLVVPAGMTVDLGHVPWPDVVVKPAVGVGGNGAVRHASQADLDALTLADEGADAVVQPYLAAVERSGEASVVCIEGEPTHAVRKRPASGEFRIHAHRGGTTEPVPVTEELADIARRTLATLPARPAYARVDMIHDGATWRVVELELVEPYLYLEHAPRVAGLLADGLLARVGATVR
jgi:glutathione synthase/RimK-type ligase-like ATP-grasp enzyme